MYKIIFLFFLMNSLVAKISQDKFNYFLEISGFDKKIVEPVQKQHETLKKIAEAKLVGKSKEEALELLEITYSTRSLKETYFKIFSKKFSEKEFNRLIAVFELPEMRRLSSEQFGQYYTSEVKASLAPSLKKFKSFFPRSALKSSQSGESTPQKSK